MKVLILEDEKRIQDSLKVLLANRGHESDAVYNVKAALSKLIKTDYNLLIVDLNIDGVNNAGIEFINLAKNMKKDIPYLIITGFTESFKGYDENILRKPFSRKRFYEAFEKHTRSN